MACLLFCPLSSTQVSETMPSNGRQKIHSVLHRAATENSYQIIFYTCQTMLLVLPAVVPRGLSGVRHNETRRGAQYQFPTLSALLQIQVFWVLVSGHHHIHNKFIVKMTHHCFISFQWCILIARVNFFTCSMVSFALPVLNKQKKFNRCCVPGGALNQGTKRLSPSGCCRMPMP